MCFKLLTQVNNCGPWASGFVSSWVMRLFASNIFRMCVITIFSEKLLVVLRDGRTLIGILRSIDQFGKFQLSLPHRHIHVHVFMFTHSST